MEFTLPDLSAYDRFAIDTETDGVHQGARAVGICVGAPDGMGWYVPFGHEHRKGNLDPERVREWARREFGREGQLKVMHNAAFDLRMLEGFGAPLAGRVEDTMVIEPLLDELQPSFSLDHLCWRHLGKRKDSGELDDWLSSWCGGAATHEAQVANYWRAPAEKVAPYGIGDALLTLELYDARRPLIDKPNAEGRTFAGIYDVETRLIRVLRKMNAIGVPVDREKAREVKARLDERCAELARKWEEVAGRGASPESPQALVTVFDALGIKYPKTGTGRPSFRKEFLKGVDHPIGAVLRELKTLTHFSNVFIGSYILGNVTGEDRLHGEFHQLKADAYGTVSGRISSGSASGLNLQNIPSRDPVYGPLIRGLFVPERGKRWHRKDYSQIEYRFLAHYAGGALAEEYRRNPRVDFHQMVSDMTKGKMGRKDAKNMNFGIVYGMGDEKLARTLGCSVAEAKAFKEDYFRRVPEIPLLRRRVVARVKERGEIYTFGGRRRRFLSVAEAKARGWNVSEREERDEYLNVHVGLNALLQGSAADEIKRAMVAVAEAIDWSETPMHLTVHDELDFSVPEGEAGNRFARRTTEIMQDSRAKVPMIVETEVGSDWGHCEAWREAA